jgi:four helix bundle protein
MAFKLLQAASEFRDSIIELVKHLPKNAPPDLRAQLVKAARSVAANIAEGFGRGTEADTLRFFRIANGSLEEAQEGLRECINAELIPRRRFYKEWNRSVVIAKMLAPHIREAEPDSGESP